MDVSLNGNIVFYSITEWNSRMTLADGLCSLGLNSHVPEPRTPPAAFKDALQEVYSGSSWDIRRLQDSDSFEVVSVKLRPYPMHNTRTEHCVARIESDGSVRFAPMPEEAADVVAAYNRHLGLLRPPQVGRAIVSIVYHLRGTALRPSGGVYWLPSSSMDKWTAVSDVIERSGVGGQNKVYVVRHAMDHDSIRAVHDALRNEVLTEAQRLEKEVNDPAVALGERALRNRESQCYALRQKIKEYEGVLGLSLRWLSEEVERVEDAAAMAALSRSAISQ